MGDCIRVTIPSVLLKPGRRQALGATLGQDCMAKLGNRLKQAAEDELAVILDLTGVTDVNGSFLKATVYWALQCGQADVKRTVQDDSRPWAIRPLKLYPFLTGCSSEVADEVEEFFAGRHVPVFHLKKVVPGQQFEHRILGALDPMLARTLKSLIELGAGTAADLAGRSEETISINGWSNRLADLHLLRLVTRIRQRKFFIYKSAADAISPWD